MKVVFRTDASVEIGTGHVMRCLTLADALAEKGADCYFICREHTGHLLDFIQVRGHKTYSLPIRDGLFSERVKNQSLAHANWLASTQQEDASLSKDILKSLNPDWLIVDHYALDLCWERILRSYCRKLMVIDDLADRQHDCDLLLDQTFGRNNDDYKTLVPEYCELLCGAQYALLRPEFAQWRDSSLQRRKKGKVEHLLINLGGVDKDNITTQILKALSNSSLPSHVRITIVMGVTSPWVEKVQQQAELLPWVTEVKVGVSNMAELMAKNDLAIGAAGATSWERCCLGLPTIMVVLADNQRLAANLLEKYNAALVLKNNKNFYGNLWKYIDKINNDALILKKISSNSSSITDGMGCQFIVLKLRNGI